jgi:hypothetical protein
MAGLLTLEAIGPKGEELAIEAGRRTEIAVGYDSDLRCATFDSELLGDEELEDVVFDALAGVDPDWQAHLRVAE